METPPELHNRLSWQEVSVEMVHTLISEENLAKAKFAAEVRLIALREIVSDTEDAAGKNDGEVSPEEWQELKSQFEEEIVELEGLLETIKNDLPNQAGDE